MKVNEILLEVARGSERRSRPLSLEEFNELRPKLQIALQKAEQGVRIYRGLEDTKAKMLYTDPTNSERVSANTLNFLTLLLSHVLPSWKAWPKRSRSLICSGDYSYADSYGKPFIVLPIGNPKIGVAPTTDIWYSFLNAPQSPEFNSLFGRFLKIVNEVFKRNVLMYSNNTDVELLTREIKAIDQAVKTDPEKMKELVDNLGWVSGVHLDMIKMLTSGNAIKSIDKYYNPIKNGFVLKPLDQLTATENEIWFSAPAVLVSPKQFDILMN